MKKNRKGFTLAELLIVVAIIAVLVAIAIPVFTSQLEKAREATDVANVRSAYATLVAQYMDNGEADSIDVPVTQKKDGWQTTPKPVLQTMKDGDLTDVEIKAKVSGDYVVSIDEEGNVKVE